MKFIQQMDASMASLWKMDDEDLIKWLFNCIDVQGCNVDIFFWETDMFMEQETEANNRSSYIAFKERGTDIMQIIIDECHRRGIKAYFHHRFSEVERENPAPDFDENGNIVPEGRNRVKYEHPDWIIKTWWKNGLWNLASEDMQNFKLDYLERMMKKYDFDGICIDYLRHLPCLPVGKQWELRECATEFMCRLKKRMSSIGRDIAVGAKLPENLKSCHHDGFDVEDWAKKGCVDFMVAGSRTINPDIEGYKKITDGTEIEIYACWDTWHVADAYHFQKADFYHGMLSNFKEQGADGVVGFNYAPAPYSQLQKLLQPDEIYWSSGDEYSDFYNEFEKAGDSTLQARYVADRRGGYPYLNGCGGNNAFAPLPEEIPNDETLLDIPIIISTEYPKGRNVKVKFVITNAKVDCDKFRVFLNGEEAKDFITDFCYTDAQIFWPEQQPLSLRTECYSKNPSTMLAIEAEFDSKFLKLGENNVSICVVDRRNYIVDSINVEKAEITIEGIK